MIRKATVQDISRIAEILIFTKRVHYRSIFQNDRVSFGEMQVLPLAMEYLENPEKLESIWVFDDEFVKGLIHIEGDRILELFVDPFFQHCGIGAALMEFAIRTSAVRTVWVLEKNLKAISFYKRFGFLETGGRLQEEGTPEFIIEMERWQTVTVQPRHS